MDADPPAQGVKIARRITPVRGGMPDATAAEAKAVKVFGLDDEQRKRLSVWERD